MDIQQDVPVKTGNFLIALYDLENFVHISKKLEPAGIFALVQEIHISTIETLQDSGPLMIKTIGDANLMIFPDEALDAKVRALHDLQAGIEGILETQGFYGKVSFSCHYGEAAVGTLGKGNFKRTDAFGDAINTVFILNGRPFKGRFVISPQLFRKLAKDTRTRFHKYTPRIVYIAE